MLCRKRTASPEKLVPTHQKRRETKKFTVQWHGMINWKFNSFISVFFFWNYMTFFRVTGNFSLCVKHIPSCRQFFSILSLSRVTFRLCKFRKFSNLIWIHSCRLQHMKTIIASTSDIWVVTKCLQMQSQFFIFEVVNAGSLNLISIRDNENVKLPLSLFFPFLFLWKIKSESGMEYYGCISHCEMILFPSHSLYSTYKNQLKAENTEWNSFVLVLINLRSVHSGLPIGPILILT